jgi:cellobiose dehydrogenase (acceptor)
MTITTYLSAGLTSRGRVGIDAALTARVLDSPWYTDAADKSAHLDFINELVNNISSVPGLVMITPDNTTTIKDYGL